MLNVSLFLFMIFISMKKKRLNENIFDAARKFTDAFFDGLKRNAVKDMISRAETANVEPEIVRKMKELERDSQELDRLIKKYSKK